MTQQKRDNIVLIGMAGAGKSTLGVVLAKHLSFDFVDTDLLIQVATQRPLQEIIDTDGYMALREIEEKTLLQMDCHHCVISTGGSAVYSETGMAHIKKDSLCIFLDVSLKTLEARISDFATRGITKRADQSFRDVFQERLGLYYQYADVVINCEELNVEQLCLKIEEKLSARQ